MGGDIVKVFYELAALTDRLRTLGWKGEVQQTERFFIYGQLRAGSGVASS